MKSMPFLLGTDTVLDYLSGQSLQGFCGLTPTQVQPKLCKNFNLIVEFSDQKKLLLKQEPHDGYGQTKGELQNEWRVHQLVDGHRDLNHLQSLISHALAFDADHSILILHYLTDYDDLETVYRERHDYPPAIAHRLGATLAELHRNTLDRPLIKQFLLGRDRPLSPARPGDREADFDEEVVPDFANTLHRVTPETFGSVTSEGLKFYELMQRYESLGRAIAHLNDLYEPCCLIHNDLKFSNLLLHRGWESQLETVGLPFDPHAAGDEALIRIIDWEKWLWGDPAFDLGNLVAAYLKRWLKSLLVSQDLPIELALQLATTPLEQVQPSLIAVVQGYLRHFPEILERFPDFLLRMVRFAGLALIQSIQAHIHYYEPFGNVGICMLQVAKTLLCSPEASIQTVFGQEAKAWLVLS